MAVTGAPTISRLARFSLTTAHADDLATFYERAFGCRRLASERLSGPDFERLMRVQGGALSVSLTLGHEVLQLLQFDRTGRSYPTATSASDLIFQHLAIAVSDMDEAYRRLLAVGESTAISRAGPRRLPASSGGVTAYKFRDPEGHPLEFLAFPADQTPPIWRKTSGDVCLGIDHSAISISDTDRSTAFYEGLGFTVSARTLNQGAEQEMLDDLPGVRVDVIALKPDQPKPHLELLHYRETARGCATARSNADVATTRLVLQAHDVSAAQGGCAGERAIVDPDGYHVLIVPPPHKPRGDIAQPR